MQQDKSQRIGWEETKTANIYNTVLIENLKEYIKLLELVREPSQIAGYKINI